MEVDTWVLMVSFVPLGAGEVPGSQSRCRGAAPGDGDTHLCGCRWYDTWNVSTLGRGLGLLLRGGNLTQGMSTRKK